MVMISTKNALEADADTLRKVAISAFLDDEYLKPKGSIPGGPPGHDELEQHVQWINAYNYFKCLVDSNIIGGCIVKRHLSHLELFGIFLHKNYLGKGVGSKFFKSVIALYPDNLIWTLETPDYAKRNHRFYERNGFLVSNRSTVQPELGFGFVTYQKQPNQKMPITISSLI